MAPEVVKNEGTTKAVDFWSLGVMFYEMLTGLTPFHAKDELKIYRNILEDEDIIFPRHIDKYLYL
jgi:serine/threonine protein kinase